MQLTDNDLVAITNAVTKPLAALLLAHEQRVQEQLDRLSLPQPKDCCMQDTELKGSILPKEMSSLNCAEVNQPARSSSNPQPLHASSSPSHDHFQLNNEALNSSERTVESVSQPSASIITQDEAQAAAGFETEHCIKNSSVADALCKAKGWSKEGGGRFTGNHSTMLTERAISDVHKHLNRLQVVISSPLFDFISAVMIIANAAVLGISVQHMAYHKTSDPPHWNAGSSVAFTCWFSLEIILRALAWRKQFCSSSEWQWNLFDVIVVSSSVAETILQFAAKGSGSSHLALIRVLRILRLVRVVRVIRVLRVLKELRMMVYSSLKCGRPWVFAMGFICMLIYMFGVHLTQASTDHRIQQRNQQFETLKSREDFGNLVAMYGSLYESMLTLFQCISGGISWRDATTPLLLIHWSYGIWMSMFVSFMTLAVLNIVTGIFVGSTVESADHDADEIIADEMEEENSNARAMLNVFEEADVDGDGFVDWEEFDTLLKDHRVRAYLHKLGVDPYEAIGLFRLLDLQNLGQVNGKEFVLGCMRLKGPAKNVDLATVLYENKRMMAVWSTFMKYVEDNLAYVSSRLEEIDSLPAAARKLNAGAHENGAMLPKEEDLVTL